MRWPLLASLVGTTYANVILYGSQQLVTGDFGPRDNATMLCEATAPEECDSIDALLSYTGDAARDLIEDMGDPVMG